MIELYSYFRSKLKLSPESRTFLIRAFWLTLVLRVSLLFMAVLVDRVLLNHSLPFWPSGFYDTFRHWDGRHYITLAVQGYFAEGEHRFLIVFFPLYPWLIRAVRILLGSALLSGLLISWGAALLATFSFQHILRETNYDEEFIERATLFFVFFPTAVFAALPYTEALFMLWVLLCFWAALKRRWFWATLLCVLAGLTRSTGILLVPALIVEALILERSQVFKRAFWLVLSPLGIVFYLALNWWVTGDPFQFMVYQREHWHQGFIMPWTHVSLVVQKIMHHTPGKTQFTLYVLRLIAMGSGLVGLLFVSRKIRLSWAVYAWGAFLMFMTAKSAISFPRYLYVLFPLYLQLAYWTRRPLVLQCTLCFSSLMLGMWFVMYAMGKGAL